LNGACINQVCKCNSGWEGPVCGVLSLVPVQKNAGFRQADSSSWCGTILVDNQTTSIVYHLYVSEMGDHCTLDQVWRTDSQIVHTTATGDPTGPYTRVDVAVTPEAHNPQARRAPDGTYLLFDSYGGPTSCPTETNKPTCTPIKICPCVPPGNGQFTFHYAANPAGPWTPFSVTMPYPCHSCNLTPSAWFHPNGTLFVMFHCDPDQRHAICDLTMVSAPHWKGPYTMVNNGDSVWNSAQAPGHTEDPFFWIDKNGMWHAIMHNDNHGVHIYSREGLNFTVATLNNSPPYPFTTDITIVGGQVLSVARRERPWLLIDANLNPSLFVTSVLPQGGGRSYTHVQGVKVV